MKDVIVGMVRRVKDIIDAPERIRGLESELNGFRSRLDAQERRIVFLEVFREVNVQAVQRIHDLQDVQESQKRRLTNLEAKVENLLLLTQMLETMASEDDDREEILSLTRSLKNNLGRAKSRVAAS